MIEEKKQISEKLRENFIEMMDGELGGSLSSMQIVNLLSILQFKFKVRSLNHDSQMEYILHADERKRGITFQL